MKKITNIEHQRKREIIEGSIQNYKMMPHCPFCGEDDIDKGWPDDDFFPEITIPVDCISCEEMWYEVYTLKELWIRSK